MTKCNDCGIVDLGITRVIKNDEEYELCPNCGAEDSVEEVDELDWIQDMEDTEADKVLELMEEFE